MNEKGMLVLSELFLPTKGGTAIWFDEVYGRLGGKEIHILTVDVPGADEHDRRHPNTVHRLRMRRVPWMWPEALPLYLGFFAAAMRVGLFHDIGVVHAGRVLPEGLPAWLAARLLKVPLVVYAHGEEITTWSASRRGPTMKRIYRDADAVIANSEFTKGLLLELGVTEERVELIHPGVDIQRFRPAGPADGMPGVERLHPDRPLLLSVGRLSERKGFDQCIRATAALKEAGIVVDYAIIGIGEDMDRLETLARTEGVTEQVHFLGHVSPDDLPRWYRRADLFMMPNRSVGRDTEGFGIVFMEAAACGTPAIAGRAGGTASAVLDGVTGLLVDGDSVQEIAAAVTGLLTDKQRMREMAAKAQQRAHENFSWERVAELTQALHCRLGVPGCCS